MMWHNRYFNSKKVMEADNSAAHHSVSAPLINKFVFLPGCHSLHSPIILLPEIKKIYNFRRKRRLSQTLTTTFPSATVMWLLGVGCIKINSRCHQFRLPLNHYGGTGSNKKRTLIWREHLYFIGLWLISAQSPHWSTKKWKALTCYMSFVVLV